jgi:HAD superfamily hydrolase (TIGR01509 family)
VLFDGDGTLVDTSYLHTVAWWQAFSQQDRAVSMARIHRAIGMGSDHLLDHLLGEDRDRSADEAVNSAHGALFAQYWPALRPLAGAADLVRACAARGLRVVLASSVQSPEFAAMRRALDVDDAVFAATCAGDVESSKPEPDLVQRALERAGTGPEAAVFVGDTGWDVEAARRADVPCVGVQSGGWSKAELTEAGAVEVYSGPDELAKRLESSILLRRGS